MQFSFLTYFLICAFHAIRAANPPGDGQEPLPASAGSSLWSSSFKHIFTSLRTYNGACLVTDAQAANKGPLDAPSRRTAFLNDSSTFSQSKRDLLQFVDSRVDDSRGRHIAAPSSWMLKVGWLGVEPGCSLRRAEIDRYLNRNTRIWLLDDRALEELDDDLQSVVNCTRGGDVLMLNATRRVKPTTRVILPRPLTLSAYVDSTEFADGVFPRSIKKAKFTCPRDDEGAFFVRAGGVTIANLQFSRCVFNATETATGVIEVDACGSRQSEQALRLHHVSFKRNTLTGSSALKTRSSSCLTLEMVGASFADNLCSDAACGALLSMNNRIVDSRFVRNLKVDDADAASFLLIAPAESRTVVIGITASSNQVGILQSLRGNLAVVNLQLSQNSVLRSGRDGTPVGCIRIVNSTAEIDECTFRSNSGDSGGIIAAERSVVEVRSSLFHGNRAEIGGAVHLNDSSRALIENCTFVRNGSPFGAALYVEGNSTCHLADCTFEKNTADSSGGACHVEDASISATRCRFSEGRATSGGFLHAVRSSVELRRSTFTRGSAKLGGAICASDKSRISMNDVSLRANRASEDGGAVWFADDCAADFADSRFLSNSASNKGGAAYAYSSEVALQHSLVKNNSAGDSGGAVMCVENCRVYLSNSTFRSNAAGEDGGVVYISAAASGQLLDTSFLANDASRSGGTVLVRDARLDVHRCRFEQGKALHGGFLAAVLSNVSVLNTSFAEGSANYGGCLQLEQDSRARVRNVSMTSCHATRHGGGIYLVQGSWCRMRNVSVFSGRAGQDGGGVYAEESTVIGDAVTLQENQAGDSGGGLCCREFTTVEVTDSLLTNNSAQYGGGTYQRLNVTGRFENTVFTENVAETSGGSSYSRQAEIVFDGCRFSNSSADFGGLVYLKEMPFAEIRHSEMLSGRGRTGGCLRAKSANVELWNVSMQNCAASEDGGGMHLFSEVSVKAQDLIIRSSSASDDGGAIYAAEADIYGERWQLNNNTAGDKGGAIYSKQEGIVNISGSVFQSSSARYGGGLFLALNAFSLMTNVTFSNSSATVRGSVCRAEESKLKAVGCIMQECNAQNGGCCSMENSTLDIAKSHLVQGMASEEGGFISATENSTVSIQETLMSRGKAETGGAVHLAKSTLKATNLNISDCSANSEGGAVAGSENSSFVCIGCSMVGNVALRRGGAIAFDSTRPQMQAVQLKDSRVTNNFAEYGGKQSLYHNRSDLLFTGGMHLIARDESVKCPDEADCPLVTLESTVFADNKASAAGGAIFSTNLSAIRIDCSSPAEDSGTSFSSAQERESTRRLESPDDVCPTWSQNDADAYGATVGSYAASVHVSISEPRENKGEDVIANHYAIEGHRSGEPLPDIKLRVTDGLGQGPAVGFNDETVEAFMTSPDGYFSGSINVPLIGGRGTFSNIVGFGTAGSYNCIIHFSEEALDPFVIEVQIRPCKIGEAMALHQTFCEPCTIDTYNLHPERSTGCLPCPNNGNCTSHTILPKKGYWHSTPCSVHIHSCISSEACDSKQRSNDLDEIIKTVESCEVGPELLKEYQEAQCREGHTGPLCGSCQESYGRLYSFRCEKCFMGISNITVVALSFLVFLGLSGFTVRSNLSSAAVSVFPREASSNQLEVVSVHDLSPGASSIAGSSVVINEQMVEMLVTGHVPEELLWPTQDRSSPPAPDPERTARELELAKWKAAELFKVQTFACLAVDDFCAALQITVSFLQVTAVAIAVNVKWTAAMFILFEIAEFMSGITSETARLSVECLIPKGSSLERSILSAFIGVCVPLAAICVFVVFWIIIKIKRRESFIKFAKRTALSVLAVLYITYMPLCSTLASILGCVEVQEFIDIDSYTTKMYWALDTSVQCHEGFHAVLAEVIGWPCFLFLVGVFPLIAAIVIFRSVKEQDYKDGWIYEVAGFMYRSYRPKLVFWESIIMLKKASMIVIVIFSYPLGGSIQHVLVVFVLIFSLYLQMICRPYRQEFDELNTVESLSALVSLITFVSSVFFHDEGVSYEIRVLVTCIVLTCNVIWFFFLLYFILVFAAKYMRGVLDANEVPYKKEMGMHHVFKAYLFGYLIGWAKYTVLRWYRHANGKSQGSVHMRI